MLSVLGASSLVYISEDLDFLESYELTMVRDAHSVAYYDRKCYIVSSGTDSIIEFSPDNGEKVFWRANDGGADTVHLNSVLWDDDGCWVTAFGPKSGPLWSSADRGYVLNVLTGERRMTALYHPHSLAKADGMLYVCESARMRIRNTQGLDLHVPRGYLRGLAVESGYILAGCTKGRKRSRSTGELIDNSADPGEPSGEPGIAIYRAGTSGADPEFDSFVDLSEFADEVYDILVLPGT